MMRRGRVWWLSAAGAVGTLALAGATGWGPRQQYARFGDVRLQSGETLRGLVVGYRTAGTLDAKRSNAVLVVPWFQGTSGDLTRQIGPGKLVDTTTHFVIMVDALGNGVSSSPSTSANQPGQAFPSLTIGDMVEAERRLVTETLQIARLRGVVGISMGGMQVFEWVVSHPEMLDRAVAIVGSPQTQPDDRERWADGIRHVQEPRWTRTRAELSAGRPRAAFGELRIQPHDYIRQAEASLVHDVTRRFGGSLERTAAALRTPLLMASTWEDRSINPKPAFELARLAGATILELDGRCGHQAPSCERAVLWPAVNAFLR